VGGWVAVAMLDDLWEGEVLGVRVCTVDVVLCNVEGELVAYEDRCPHLATPLSNGSLDPPVLTCVAHEWEFDVRTGHGVNPTTACLRRFPVRTDGDTILVDIESVTP